MRNTIKKVTIVVPVLITSCHVLLKLKIGPVKPQTTMIPQARTNAVVVPAQRVTTDADRSSHRPSALSFLRATITRCSLQHPASRFTIRRSWSDVNYGTDRT